MRNLTLLAVLAVFSAGALAQDKITLVNGDVVTGTIKTMADGKVTITSPLLGDVIVPMSNISDMVTKAQVDLETKGGEKWNRRIVGIEGGNLRLEGDVPSMSLDNLAMINPPAKPEPSWAGSLQVNGLLTDGNTERRGMGLALAASRRTEIDRITVDVGWDYSEDRRFDTTQNAKVWTLTQRRAGGGLQYDYFISKRWYWLATARVLGDTLADLSLRFTGGAGLGYTIIDDAETTLTVEAGLSYFNENYISSAPSQDYVAARFAYKLTHKLSDKTKLVHGAEVYPSLENAKDTYLQAKTEITTSLTDSMIASLAHVIDWDNTPSPGLQRADQRLVLSVGWTF